MAAIDLSKAKTGDKFRIRAGEIVEYVAESICGDTYIVRDKSGFHYHVHACGTLFEHEKDGFDLIEQVFDEPLSAMERIERDERINRDMQKMAEIADEERQELQRRKEVVELARKMLFDDNTYQFYTQFYVRAKQNEGAEQVMTYLQYVMDYAEDCVNKFNQYLKEGKL